MSSRELIVLGSSSQVPTRYRNHNAYFLRWDDVGLLFDPGEGTQRQMIYAGLAASQIHHVLITHFHGDHALGLAGLVQRISLDRVEQRVHVHYPASGQVYFDRLRHATIFVDNSKIEAHPIREEGVIWEEENFSIEARRVDHGVETFGYRLKERDGRRMSPERLAAAGIRGPAVKEILSRGSLQVEGREVRLEEVSDARPGQIFAFVMDSRPCPGADRLAANADMLVCEATYQDSERREAWEHQHMTATQAAEIARKAGARLLVLTHFSQRYPDVEGHLHEARQVFPEVVAAADLKHFSVPRRLA